jgi:dephospho-CoA kinase
LSRPFRLGLTGSVGMGKSTTAALFAEEGLPVWDADAAVHRLYDRGGAGAAAIAALVPAAVSDAGVDRQALRAAVMADPGLLAQIEAAIHPLVAADREAFLDEHGDEPLVVLDIPLLFETGLEDRVDAVLVVSAPEAVQRARVLARPGMTEAALAGILARQLPDPEKRARANHLIETDNGVEAARAAVRALIDKIGAGNA